MMMNFKLLILFLITMANMGFAQGKPEEQLEWAKVFDKYNAKGTILVVDKRSSLQEVKVFNSERANKRFAPASTFKVPHTLFALDAGLVKDEFQIFPWDGVKRSFKLHNQDQNLRSAMRYSALWVYEIFAKQLGEEKAKNYLKKIDYGNMDPRTDTGVYWIDGKLAISAYEQIDFLKKLYRNTLPFQKQHLLLLKDLMIVEAGSNWILRAKTGWQGSYGWWVGWVEWPSGPVFFALNIDTPNKMKDLYKRQAIVKDILLAINALPTNK
ncbi:class D beta-lactamase [Agarilytica rhodophyticola]|uniref:class D beta-lactamase n=1 Tax=Agarilytica rhodophyticola TaxID=1737490 RepID=UPI003CCBE00C